MTKSQFSILLAVLALITLFITNPKEEEHKSAVKSKLNSYFQQSLNQNPSDKVARGLGALIGPVFMERLVDVNVHRDNYLLFSTTVFKYENEPKTIGLGNLGNVFLSSKIDKSLSMDMKFPK